MILTLASVGSAPGHAAVVTVGVGPAHRLMVSHSGDGVAISPLTPIENELGLAPEELADVSLGHALLNAEVFQHAAELYLDDLLAPEREVALTDGPARGLNRLMARSLHPATDEATPPRPRRGAALAFGFDTSPQVTPSASPAGAQRPQDSAAARALDMIRLFLNMRSGPARENSFRGPAPDLADALRDRDAHRVDPLGSPGKGLLGSSLVVDALDTAVAKGSERLMRGIFDPALEANGYISLSFAGLTRFVFVVSPETNSVSVIDADTGRSFSLSGPPSAVAGMRGPASDEFGNSLYGQKRGEHLTFIGLFTMLLDQLAGLSTEPSFLVSVMIVGILWVLWRLRRHRAEI